MSKIGALCFNCQTVNYDMTESEVAHGMINGLTPVCPTCQEQVYLFNDPQKLANQEFWGEDEGGNKFKIQIVCMVEDDNGFTLQMCAEKVVE